jgi:hypothetical protein
LDPRPEDVDIRDIAHGLSNICRFGGHVREFYSVAQHTVLVSLEVERSMRDRFGGEFPEIALWLTTAALHHEDAEAYIGDMVRPLKIDMPAFSAVEFEIIERAIAPFLGLDDDLFSDDSITCADILLLATEARDLMGDPEWARRLPKQDDRIEPMSPRDAREYFLHRHCELTGIDRRSIVL